MRPDIQKVIVERPRGGRSRDSRKWGKRLTYAPGSDYEDEAKFVSASAKRQYSEPKWFSDFLSPLRGFLRQSLGRPWNKVHGELSEGIDTRKVTGRHVFDHVRWMVTTACFIDSNGVVRELDREFEVYGFYVHPRTGLLCFIERPSKRQRLKEKLIQQPMDEVSIDRTTSYRLLDGQWYLVTHCFYKIGWGSHSPVWDAALRQHVQLHRGINRVAVGKRQCNHAEVVKILAQIEQRQKEIRRV